MLIELAGVRKHFGGLRPLRVNALQVTSTTRVTLRGLDAQAAEMFCLLVTGAAVPDEGTIQVSGRDTRAITTDTEWLTSLDVFGMVSNRAVLLGSMTLESNLALPFTLSIEPVPEEVRRAVASLADEVGLGRERLSMSVQALSAEDRVRTHLARALAASPKILLLEHITATLTPEQATRLGRTLTGIADDRELAWIALTEDAAFAESLGGTRLMLDAASGEVRPDGRGWTEW